MKFRNSKGELKTAPRDKGLILANIDNGVIVFSANKSGDFRVRYCLEVTDTRDKSVAVSAFGFSVIHHAECEGKLPYSTGI